MLYNIFFMGGKLEDIRDLFRQGSVTIAVEKMRDIYVVIHQCESDCTKLHQVALSIMGPNESPT